MKGYKDYNLNTVNRWFFLAFLTVALIVFWQQINLIKKNSVINKLTVENISLKEEMLAIDYQLSELKDQASDVRIFHKEMIKVIKDIDHNYPIDLMLDKDQHYHANNFHHNDNVSDRIWKLANVESDLRIKGASLLGQAAFMREILSHTPSLMPVATGYISSNFGVRKDPFSHKYIKHHGIDIAAPLGTPVYASADGKVKIASRNISFGNLIEIVHSNGYSTSYAHLSEILVRKDQTVKKGQEIGRVGKTGTRCHGSHVHFEVKKHGIHQDPKPYLISKPAVVL